LICAAAVTGNHTPSAASIERTIHRLCMIGSPKYSGVRGRISVWRPGGRGRVT
jgi:hypothetical protein